MPGASFVSTTIPYVNAHPHLGHALEYVQADAYARHMAATGQDVYLLTGSDENSLKNVLAAERAGVATSTLVGRNVVHFRRLVDELQVGVRRFIRTSVDSDHLRGATELWRRMAASGDIYAEDYEGRYCVGCEQFYAPEELVGGVCPEHLAEPEPVRERNWFFRLSRYGDRLLDELRTGRLRVVPESRLNEVTGFIRAGLTDISISRSTERARGWGIPVPDDPTQVMYVWIDALTNYVNALGWVDGHGDYRRYWTGADRRVHLVGKGVLRFHAVYWPAMLASAGLPLPTEIVAHGYLTAAGRKLSKTLGNTVDPTDLLRRYGVNAVRHFLLAECPPFGDADVSEGRLVARYNADVANGLGNLVNRIASMIIRYRNGVVPAPGTPGEPERALAAQMSASDAGVRDAMACYDHREALRRVWDLVRRTNVYVDEHAPWHLARAAGAGDAAAAAELDTALHHLVAAVRQIARLVSPFLPGAAAAILDVFGEPSGSVPAGSADAAGSAPRAGRWLDDCAGRRVANPGPLFPRLAPPAGAPPAGAAAAS